MAKLTEDGWEQADFPILCETCLGDNPYVRMMKANFSSECKICERPFTVFRWKAGRHGRFKKTELCQTCAKLKNVCQTCIFDLQYNLPVQVRDSALEENAEDVAVAQTGVNKEYFAAQYDERVAGQGTLEAYRPGKLKNKDMCLRLARMAPYYKRNMPHICSFWVKGECNRGNECPYRHEMPQTGEMAEQNIKDRYYGKNDPVAKKMMNEYTTMEKPTPPENTDITTLYIGAIPSDIDEKEIRDEMYAYGDIESIRLFRSKQCAFIKFVERGAAERCIDDKFEKLLVRGRKLKLLWARPEENKDADVDVQQPSTEPAVPGTESFSFPPPPGAPMPPPGMMPPPPPFPAPAMPTMPAPARPPAMGPPGAPGAPGAPGVPGPAGMGVPGLIPPPAAPTPPSYQYNPYQYHPPAPAMPGAPGASPSPSAPQQQQQQYQPFQPYYPSMDPSRLGSKIEKA